MSSTRNKNLIPRDSEWTDGVEIGTPEPLDPMDQTMGEFLDSGIDLSDAVILWISEMEEGATPTEVAAAIGDRYPHLKELATRDSIVETLINLEAIADFLDELENPEPAEDE